MAAETILIPVAKQILGKAADLAVEQLGLLWNFRRELRKLKDTVSRIQAVLRDAEEKQFHNHQVKDWLEKLSDIMYDADDLLDDLATEARRKAMLAEANDDGGRRRTSATNCWSLVCFLFSSLPQQLLYDLMMAHAIKAIREKLDDISKDKETLNLEVHPIEEDQALSFRETDSCPPTIVVGREDDKKKIIQLLLNSNQEANISVVPIVGMGGLGKTTLAQLIFDDDQVKAHFGILAWVYVSQKFDVKTILGKMLRSIDRESLTGPELNYLQFELREKTQDKRFLFVLDDVWEETDRSWETLGKYFAAGAFGSKVLVTTRSTKVAEVSGRALKSKTSTNIVEPYHLKGLSDEECWNLLVEKTLPRNVPRELQVQEIGKQILRKCNGIPLAVSTIAGVLVDSRDPKIEWPSFLHKSLSSMLKVGEENPTMSALLLSFNHLPSHIKHCFTYCKLFPKGNNLNIHKLVQFWVAEGYIESEDKGFDCFKTLWWRSFFQEVEMDLSGNMLTCRMHDLMRDLADLTAGEKIIGSSSSSVLKTIPPKTRHLAVTYEDNDDDVVEDYGGYGLGNTSKVRTLMFLKSYSNEELAQVLKNFSRLRVLIIDQEEDLDLDSDVEESVSLDASTPLNYLYKLKHLRYLALDCTGRKKLLDAITNLVNLQVLNLSSVWSLEELPRVPRTLVNLKHLELAGYGDEKLPNWLSGLTNLVEFSLKGSGRCQYLPQLHQMSSLKKLTIENCPLLVGIYNDRDISVKNSATALTEEEEDEDEWPRFPRLVQLNIWNCRRLTRLPTFPAFEGKLVLDNVSLAPFARTMKMNMRRGGEGGVDSSDESAYVDSNIHPLLLPSSSPLVHPLSKLTKLLLSDIDDDLESLSHNDSSSCLVSLQELTVQNCHRGVKLPGSLCSSTYLKEIYIGDCRTVEYLPALHELPSLRKLNIERCETLKGCWWKKKKKKQQGNNDDDDNHNGGGDYHYYNFDPSMEGEADEKEDEEEEWPHFLCLSSLAVKGCPKLTRMPLFPTVEGELRLSLTSAQALVRTMKMKPVAAQAAHHLDSQHYSTTATTITSSSSSSLLRTALLAPLSKLTTLTLVSTKDLECLPEEGLRNLTSLEKLEIWDCPLLQSLPPAMQQLTSLQSLCIQQCATTKRFKGEDWPNISHIPYVELNGKTLQGSGEWKYKR